MTRRQTSLRPSEGGRFASPVGPSDPTELRAAMTASDHDGPLYEHPDPQWVAMFIAYREPGLDVSDVGQPTITVGGEAFPIKPGTLHLKAGVTTEDFMCAIESAVASASITHTKLAPMPEEPARPLTFEHVKAGDRVRDKRTGEVVAVEQLDEPSRSVAVIGAGGWRWWLTEWECEPVAPPLPDGERR